MEFIPFARPSIGEAEVTAVTTVLRSGWLTTGAEAAAFEREFAACVGAPHALAVSSATAGLHLALEAVGVGRGDTVVVPSLTFAATAEVARYLGAEVAFADISEDGFLIDPKSLDAACADVTARGGRVRAILPVHLGGEVCNMEAVRETARRYGAAVVEDAAHAFPSPTAMGFAGTMGDAGVYSFYATKTITTAEGGMVCTRDAALAERIKLMRLHGIDREAWDRYQGAGAAWYYQVVEAGYKYNLPDLLAALGRVQLQRAHEFFNRRRDIAARYSAAFADVPFVRLPRDSEGHSWHLYMLRINAEALGGSRDAAIEALKRAGIGTSVHYIPLHIMPYYARRYALQPEALPNTWRRWNETLSLPIYPDLTDAHVERICAVVRRLPELVRA